MSDAMREALEPFAGLANVWCERYGTNGEITISVDLADLDRARAALAPQPALEATDDPYDPSPHCPLDACRREGCTRHAHMCLSKQPAAPSPALSPATVEALRALIVEHCHVNMKWPATSQIADHHVEPFVAALRALASPAPSGEPVAWRNPNTSINPVVLAYQKEDMRPEIASGYSVPLYAAPCASKAVSSTQRGEQ